MNSRRHGLTLSALGIVAAIGLAGCGHSTPAPTSPIEPPLSGLESCGGRNIFHRSNFPNPTVIDSKWFPLRPGKQMIFDGEADRGSGIRPHRVVMTVTSLTKVVSGVRTLVMWDRDYNEGVLQESELAFFAQDKFGNVWTIGEYPEEYSGGVFVGAPSTWFMGIQGAEAGILVPGSPAVGNKFLQGFAPDCNFLDCAMVWATGQSTCVPFNCYENVLIIDEHSPLEVGSGHQRKFYASGIGNVRIEPVDDPEGEVLVLTNVLDLSPTALEEANAEAMKLEQHGYQVNEVYRRTERMSASDVQPK